jgi:hypothetical protein
LGLSRSNQLILIAATQLLLLECSKLDSQTQLNSRTKSTKSANGTTVQADDEGATRGTSIFIPASAQEMDGDQFQIENGPARIANQTTAAYLSVPGTVAVAGEPVAITYGDVLIHEKAGALILSLPIQPQTGLALRKTESDIVVFYEIFTDSDKVTTVGIIPNSSLTIESDKISFKLRGFGTYQVGYLSQPITSEVSKPNDGKTIPLNNLAAIRKANQLIVKTTTTTKISDQTEDSTTTNSGNGDGVTSTSSTGTGEASNTGSTSSGTSGTNTGGTGSSTTGGSGTTGGGSGSNGNWNTGWTELASSAFPQGNSAIGHLSVGISPGGAFVAAAAQNGSSGNFSVVRYSSSDSTPVNFAFSYETTNTTSVAAAQVSVDDTGMVFLSVLIASIQVNELQAGLKIFAALLPEEILAGSIPDIDVSATDVSKYQLEMHSHAQRGILNISSKTIGGIEPEFCKVVAFQANALTTTVDTRIITGLVGQGIPNSVGLCGSRTSEAASLVHFTTPVQRGESIAIDQGLIDLAVPIGSELFVPNAPISIALPVVLGQGAIDLNNGQIRITPAANGQYLTTIKHQQMNLGPLYKSAADTTFFSNDRLTTATGGFIALDLTGEVLKYPATGVGCSSTTSCVLMSHHETNLPSIELHRLSEDLFGFLLSTGPIIIDRILAASTDRNTDRVWSSWQHAYSISTAEILSTSIDYGIANTFALARLTQGSITGVQEVQLLIYVR